MSRMTEAAEKIAGSVLLLATSRVVMLALGALATIGLPAAVGLAMDVPVLKRDVAELKRAAAEDALRSQKAREDIATIVRAVGRIETQLDAVGRK